MIHRDWRLSAFLATTLAAAPVLVTAHEAVSAPKPLGPYASVRCAHGWVFVSGQIPFDPATGQLSTSEDIRVQARIALDNLKAALASAGAGLGDVLKVTVLLQTASDMTAMNEVYRTYFVSEPLPARTTIPGVDFGAVPIRIEIDATALLPEGATCAGNRSS
ncbi:MAG: RidA family protein [Lysobacter sp.]